MTVRGAQMSFPRASSNGWESARLRRLLAVLPRFTVDTAIVVSVVAVYFLARGQAPGRESFAVNLTSHLVAFERSLHIFWEPAIQDVSIRHYWVQEVANFVYAYLHFPVLGAIAVWLWFRGRERFTFMRNTMFISMLIGLVFYYLFPAAPPRLMALHGYNLGFVDTVFGGNTSVSYAQPSLVLNEYAAIPSFHFGWIAMASAAIWVNTSSRTLRTVALLLSVVMAWAIVASANHLFLDMVLGGAVVWISWRIARHLESRALRNQADGEPLALPASARAA